MKTFKLVFGLIAVVMVSLFSCSDKEEIYDNADYKYYLNIQSQVSLNLKDADENQGTMSNSGQDLLSKTVAHMQKAVQDNESQKGDTHVKEAALLAACDSVYRQYADMNPENKGAVVCFVKLIRTRVNRDGTTRDAVALKYYQFWYEYPENFGDGNGNNNSNDYLAPPDSLEAVDLGLSVFWANCNIGASQPRNYGAHLAWGDSTGILWSGRGIGWNDNGYTWSTDNYGGNNPPAEIAETTLDVVTANWGDGWHIPSYSEAKELCEQCQWKMRTWGDIKWYEVIGPNGNSIIMPLAGMYGDDVNAKYRFQAGPYGVTEKGYYWTSTSCATPSAAEQRGYGVNEGVITAWCFKFNSNDGDDLTPVFIDHLRAMHMSIRPVKNK